MVEKIEELTTTSAEEMLNQSTVSAALGASVNREVSDAATATDAKADADSHVIEVGEASVEGAKEDIYSRPVSRQRNVR